MVDTELVVISYLRAHEDLAEWPRIGPRTPASLADPWAVVTLIDARQDRASRALHLIDAIIQIDCYAGDGGQAEANDMARAVITALHEMPAAEHDDAVVTFTKSSLRRLPDVTFQPARERYVVETTMALHD